MLSGPNKLTNNIVIYLASMYAHSIKKNRGKGVLAVQRDVLATFLHCSSTDDAPKHIYCPDDKDSWCFYKKAIANGIEPQSHTTMKIRFVVPERYRKRVMAVYADLAKTELLERCLKGETQNRNESLHGKLWGHLSKVNLYGFRTCQYSTALTLVHHNFGHTRVNMPSLLGIISNENIMKSLESRDEERRRVSARPSRPKGKRKRTDDSEYLAGGF